MTEQEFVTGSEFGRWRADFSEWQNRLERRLDTGFGQINDRLDALNGRTRKCEQDIASLRAVAADPPIPTRTEQWKNAGLIGAISTAVVAASEGVKALVGMLK